MTTAPHPVSERSWETLHTDEKLALKQASARLADKFAGLYGKETIERFLASSFDQFADHAKVTKFLPLLAERFAHQRLTALARIEGLHDDGKPVVLFLCTHNAGRSQMALGFFQALTGDNAVAWSGGSEPGIEVNPAAIAAMAERGIDISGEFPKPWTDETVRAADVVVTTGDHQGATSRLHRTDLLGHPVVTIIIPMVLAPLAAQADPGTASFLVAVGYAFYGMGFLLFLLTLGLVYDRLILHPLPPAALAPSVWIGLGPVGVAALAPLALAKAGTPIWGEAAAAVGLVTQIASTAVWGFGLWWLMLVAALLVRYRAPTRSPSTSDGGRSSSLSGPIPSPA